MKRLVVVGLLFGLLNAAAAVAALYGVDGAVPTEFGWFAYAPLNETVVYDPYAFPWKYVVVPVVLLVLNALLLPLAVRRDWLRRQVPRTADRSGPQPQAPGRGPEAGVLQREPER